MSGTQFSDIDPIHAGVFQPQLLLAGLNASADRAVIHLPDGTSLTGAGVAAAISRFMQALRHAGVGKGSRLAILSGNRVEVLLVGDAVMFLEASATALHPLGSVEDYAYVALDAGIDTVVFDAQGYASKVAELKARVPGIRRFLSLGPCDFAEDLVAAATVPAAQPLTAPLLNGTELFKLAYSGGTTGKPKAIQCPYLVAQQMTIIQMAEWEWPRDIRQLLCAPLSHSGAAMFLPTLLRGGTVYIQPRFDPAAVMAAIEKHRINCILMVPTMIYALLDHPRFSEFDLSSLETIFYGASSISPARLREGIEKLGPVFFQFYGQAEAPMSVTVMRRGEHDVNKPLRLASCGRPVPWVQVQLLDNQGMPVPDGTPGELCVRGQLVTPGYLNQPELTAEVFRDGWLHTGDVAIRDDDGFLRIVDRTKDMVITGGFNVYPREVEDALSSHPAVAAASVIGLPDDHWGEIVMAAVVLRAGVTIAAADLSAHVRALKGAVMAPKRVEFLTELPLTPVGKPDKKALRSRFKVL